jgi:signal peptidase I
MTDPYQPPAAPVEALPRAPPTPGRPAIAAVLSLLALGTGHVYAGRPLRGLGWYGGLVLATALAGLLIRPAYAALGLTGLALVFLLPFAVYVATARDAARQAPSRPTRFATGVVIVALIGFWLGRVPISFMLRAVFIEAFKIPQGGVLPTLAVGDHIFADKLLPRLRAAHRGELVVFPYPEQPDADFVKRVVALPGETVRVEGPRLFINGWPVPHCDVGRWSYSDPDTGQHEGVVAMEFLGDSAYLVFDDASVPALPAREWHVADGELFVMGDNRNNSHDSRMWYGGRGGGVPVKTVLGFALTIWVSVNDKGVDGDRTGADLTGRKPLAPRGLEQGVARCLAARPSGMVGPPPR